MVNTFVLSLDTYPIERQQEMAIEYVNLFFYWVFLGEMVIKVIGMGFKNYLKVMANRFDFFIVIVSTVDLLLSTVLLLDDHNDISFIKVFRLLRVFKLAKTWDNFNYFLVTM